MSVANLDRSERKVNMPLYAPRKHFGDVAVQLRSFLTSILDGSVWSDSWAG